MFWVTTLMLTSFALRALWLYLKESEVLANDETGCVQLPTHPWSLCCFMLLHGSDGTTQCDVPCACVFLWSMCTDNLFSPRCRDAAPAPAPLSPLPASPQFCVCAAHLVYGCRMTCLSPLPFSCSVPGVSTVGTAPRSW